MSSDSFLPCTQVLDEGNIVAVLKKLLKLPWAEHERYVLKCLLKVSEGGRWHWGHGGG